MGKEGEPVVQQAFLLAKHTFRGTKNDSCMNFKHEYTEEYINLLSDRVS